MGTFFKGIAFCSQKIRDRNFEAWNPPIKPPPVDNFPLTRNDNPQITPSRIPTSLRLKESVEDKLPQEILKLSQLQEFIQKSDVNAVKEILLQIPVDDLNSSHLGPKILTLAASMGNLEIVKLLVDAGAISLKALSYAAQNSHSSIVAYLLDQGADPEYLFMDNGGYLHAILPEAIKPGNLECVQLLIAYAKDKVNYVNSRGESGNYPVKIAINQDCADILEVLLAHGASLGEAYQSEMDLFFQAAMMRLLNILQFLHQKGISLNLKTPEGLTALHIAASNNDQKTVEFLLANGGDPTATTVQDISYIDNNVTIGKGADYKKFALMKLNAIATDNLVIYLRNHRWISCTAFNAKESLQYVKNPKDMSQLLIPAIQNMHYVDIRLIARSLFLKGGDPRTTNAEGKSGLRIAREKLKEIQEDKWADPSEKEECMTFVDKLHAPFINSMNFPKSITLDVINVIKEYL